MDIAGAVVVDEVAVFFDEELQAPRRRAQVSAAAPRRVIRGLFMGFRAPWIRH
jgi:hypothetical protein